MGEAVLLFRRHPDVGPGGKVSIIGPARCSAERMTAYASRRNAAAPDIADAYLRIGARYGVRGDVAYCQALYDTRAWTAEPAGPPWRPFPCLTGIAGGSGGDAAQGWEAVVDKHIRLLYAFASAGPLPAGEAADVRFARLERAGWRGTVAHWEDLNGKWLLPGHRYGQDVVAIWRGMMDWKGKGEVHVDKEVEDVELVDKRMDSGGIGGCGAIHGVGGPVTSGEDLEWLRVRGLLPVQAPHPGRGVTWAELAVLLRKWDEGAASDKIGG